VIICLVGDNSSAIFIIFLICSGLNGVVIFSNSFFDGRMSPIIIFKDTNLGFSISRCLNFSELMKTRCSLIEFCLRPCLFIDRLATSLSKLYSRPSNTLEKKIGFMPFICLEYSILVASKFVVGAPQISLPLLLE